MPRDRFGPVRLNTNEIKPMAKILVALDEDTMFAKDLIATSRALCSQWKKNLYVGLVVKDLSYNTRISSFVERSVMADINPYLEDDLLTEEDHQKAELLCNFIHNVRPSGLNYEIYNDFKMSTHEVIKQTTYADLLILSYQIFQQKSNRFDNVLLYQVLKESKCPVLIIPKGIRDINNIIFAYDGKESSVFAIKSFSSLFADAVKDKPVSILTVTPSLEEEIKNEKFLLELAKHYYNNVGVQLLEGSNISAEIKSFADTVENPLVVMGAYGRSSISNLLIPSVARGIIEDKRLPLFIAHR